jgi:hypothetical protein
MFAASEVRSVIEGQSRMNAKGPPHGPIEDPDDEEARRLNPKHGLKGLSVWLPPEYMRQLRLISAEHDKKQRELLMEALNDLFVKYGRKPVA